MLKDSVILFWILTLPMEFSIVKRVRFISFVRYSRLIHGSEKRLSVHTIISLLEIDDYWIKADIIYIFLL